MRSLRTPTKSRPRSPQLEKAHTQQRRPNAAIKEGKKEGGRAGGKGRKEGKRERKKERKERKKKERKKDIEQKGAIKMVE